MRWCWAWLGLVLVGASWSGSSPTPPSFAPLTYFEQNCARCHGREGGFYDPKFLESRSERWLLREVLLMADAQAGAPIHIAQGRLLTDYHRALSDGEPFAVWTEWTANEIRGEVSSATSITANVGSETLNASISGKQWVMTLPPLRDRRTLVLSVQRGDQTLRWRPSAHPTTHPTRAKKSR